MENPSITSAVFSSTFDHFSNLPFDLRFIIWSLLRSPRLIAVTRDIQFETENPEHHRCKARTTSGTDSCLSLLRTCRESRSIAVQFYSLTFRLQFPHPIYFDPSIDTLYIHDIATSQSFYKAIKESFQLWKQRDGSSSQSSEKAAGLAIQYETTSMAPYDNYPRELILGLILLASLFHSLPKVCMYYASDDDWPTGSLDTGCWLQGCVERSRACSAYSNTKERLAGLQRGYYFGEVQVIEWKASRCSWSCCTGHRFLERGSVEDMGRGNGMKSSNTIPLFGVLLFWAGTYSHVCAHPSSLINILGVSCLCRQEL